MFCIFHWNMLLFCCFALEHSSQLFHFFRMFCIGRFCRSAVLYWNIPLNFSTLTHAFFLWVLCRFPTYLRRISTFFHPPQLGIYTYPLRTFSTPTPYGTPIFHLEHPPQVQTVVVGWSFELTVLLGEFKFFHPKTPVCRS